MADIVAGDIGFTITWNPLVGQPGNVASLAGLTCTMNVQSDSGYTASFPMTVDSLGQTASYTTLSAGDFPASGRYAISFSAANVGGSIVLSTVSQYRNVFAGI